MTAFLEAIYDLMEIIMKPIIGWIKPESPLAKVVAAGEAVSKKAMFGCQMCGQCILHSTGMICPMNCPKTLRNGPCGGVRDNGHCEVKPEMRCVWTRAYLGSLKMRKYGHEINIIQPPVNHQLKNTASWVDMYQGVDKTNIENWYDSAIEEVNHAS